MPKNQILTRAAAVGTLRAMHARGEDRMENGVSTESFEIVLQAIDASIGKEEIRHCGFEHALIMMREGRRVCRESWDDTFLTVGVDDGVIMFGVVSGDKIGVRPWSVTDNTEDLLAEDWVIIEDKA